MNTDGNGKIIPVLSDWFVVDEEVDRDNVTLEWIVYGGNGTGEFVLGNVYVELTAEARPPISTIPEPETPDLPDGPPWGNIVFDADAASPAMLAAYDDGDDVNTFFDGIAADNLTTVATLLLPKYRASGFAGARPCVEWDGANVPLSAPINPTQPYGSYTYYFVLDNLDGGDGARIWGAGFGDSFQYSIYCDGDTVYAANNNLFGNPSLFAEDSGGTAWGMAEAHIYRWVKDAASSAHRLFVDGVLKASAGAAPQTNNAGAVD